MDVLNVADLRGNNCIVGDDFVLSCNDGNLNIVGVCLDRDGLFEVIVSFLLAPEAVDLVICQCICGIRVFRDTLYKSNHSLVAHGVEFLVVSGGDGLELFGSVGKWVLRDSWLKCIFKVSQESHAVLKVDLESLIIDGGPGTSDVGGLTLSTGLALLCLSLILIEELDPPEVLSIKFPLMIL